MKILVKAAKKPGIDPNRCGFTCGTFDCGDFYCGSLKIDIH